MMFFLIVKCIFACNHEAKNTTQNYMVNFDLRNFDAGNISKAIININAVACALGDSFSSNMVQCVLVGIGKASNKVFNRTKGITNQTRSFFKISNQFPRRL